MAPKKIKKASKKAKQRKLFPSIIIRGIVLLVITSAILAVGHYRYGWHILGPSERSAYSDHEQTPAGIGTDEQEASNYSDPIKQIIEKHKNESETKKTTPEPAADNDKTPDPANNEMEKTPKLTKKQEKKDKAALEDFLESQF